MFVFLTARNRKTLFAAFPSINNQLFHSHRSGQVAYDYTEEIPSPQIRGFTSRSAAATLCFLHLIYNGEEHVLQPEALVSFCWFTYPHWFSYKNSRLSFTYQILNNRSARLFHYNKLCARGFTKSLRGGKSQPGIFLMRLRKQLETMKWCEEIPRPSSLVVRNRSPYLEILQTVRLSKQCSSNLQEILYAYIII